MTRATLLHEGVSGVMRRTSGHGDLDKYLTADVLDQVVTQPGVSRIQAGMAYLGLVQTGLTRPCALGWLVVDGPRLMQGSLTRFDDIKDWWEAEWAGVAWRERGWLLHAAGVIDPAEQEALWRDGLDRQMLLTMAALRGHVIPSVLSRPTANAPTHIGS